MKVNPKSFEKWLLTHKGFAIKTAQIHRLQSDHYLEWLATKKLNIKKTTYHHLLDFIGHLQNSLKSKPTINAYLRTLNHLYDYLGLTNIAYKVHVRGTPKNMPLLLNEEELSRIYENYTGYVGQTSKSYFKYSNKLLLSFFIYQAADLQDLVFLSLTDVDLEKGIVHLPAGSHRKNSRIVKLEAHQIIPLHTYITRHRNRGKTNYYKGNTDLLFAPQAEKKQRLTNQCRYIQKTLIQESKELGINYQNLNQLRHSRIAIWIRQYGLREAQYLSGRKRISTVERYKQLDLQDLSQQVQQFHPLQ